MPKFHILSESYLTILDALYQTDAVDPVFAGIEFVVPICGLRQYEKCSLFWYVKKSAIYERNTTLFCRFLVRE